MVIEHVGGDVRVNRAAALVGEPALPGSKSLTNRYLACAALADGPSVLRGASLSDDAQAMIVGLRQLGVAVTVDAEGRALHVTGARGGFVADDVALDVGHAGTAMRFLTALACLGHGRRRLDGSARMRARPIGDLVAALESLGARLVCDDVPGYPPVAVTAGPLAGGEVTLTSPPSSQFLSAVLMVTPYATADVLIRIAGDLPSRPYVDLTLDVMRAFGVEVIEHEGQRFIVPAWQRYRGGEHAIEPDASAATYFWAAAAITGGRVRVVGLSRRSRQGDVAFVDVLAQMGCRVEEEPDALTVAAPADGRLRGISVDLNAMPDTAQTLAVVALFAEGPTDIRNVPNLRIKETDRIAALAAELTRLGATVTPRADGLTIVPPTKPTPAEITTYDDHRMAMSFAVAGLGAGGVLIRDAGCVSKSFPGFFDVLARVGACEGGKAGR